MTKKRTKEPDRKRQRRYRRNSWRIV